MNDSSTHWLVAIIGLLAIGAAIWFYRTQVEPPAPEPEPAQVAPEPEPVEPESPHYPVPSRTEPGELVPLPPLEDSDAYFALALVDLLGGGIEDLLANSALIEKFVTTVDNLDRDRFAERLRPVPAIPGSFQTLPRGDEYLLNPENYARYEFLIAMCEAADMDELIDMYQRFYPLLQEAYVKLGYPQGHFNDRAVEIIDHLLETPDIEDPVLLVRPHVFYEYADADLEALSSGQKLMLRMGSRNAARIKSLLISLRARIIEFAK